jgi:hypothetical protein
MFDRFQALYNMMLAGMIVIIVGLFGVIATQV